MFDDLFSDGSLLRNLLPKIGGGLDTSTGNRNVNLDKIIANPEYDILKGGTQYEELPPGTRIGPEGNIISETAPRGLWRVIAGGLDRILPTDLDRRGEGRNRWGEWSAEPGTLGGEPIRINPQINNPNYNPNAATQTSPVPNMPLGDYWKNVLLQDAYTGWRDPRRMNQYLGLATDYLKDANYYAAELDRRQLADYIASPLGASRLRTEAAQQTALPRMAKAALIEARAKSQQAANEFGQLGLQRTFYS